MISSFMEIISPLSSVPLPFGTGLLTTIVQLMVMVLVLVYVRNHWKISSGDPLPPGPAGLPIVGYLPFLGKEPHKKLAELGKTYGSVFSVRLGGRFAVVLNDYQAIKEAFVKQGWVFAGRPSSNIFTTRGQEQVLSAGDGPIWKAHRQFAFNSLKMLGLGKSSVEPLIKSELHNFLGKVKQFGGEPNDISDLLRYSIANNICALIFGRCFDYEDSTFLRVNYLINERLKRYSNVNSRLFFPWMKRVPFLSNRSGYSKMLQLQDNLLKEIRRLIENHKGQWADSSSNSYTADYLQEQKRRWSNDPNDSLFNDEILEGNLIVLLAAGSDSVGLIICWALKYLILYPEVQQRLQEELDRVIGKDCTPCWEDRTHLPYTMATILEIMRLTSVIPLNIAHSNICDTTLFNYKIPERSYIISNIWAVHHSPELWGDPENFRPERFLNEDGTVKNIPYLIPFSLGPRTCLGESMARMELFLYLTMILQRFTIKVKEGVAVDLDCDVGFTLRPNTFEACFESR